MRKVGKGAISSGRMRRPSTDRRGLVPLIFLLLLSAVGLVHPAAAGLKAAKVPAWLLDEVGRTAPAPPSNTKSVCLLEERSIVLSIRGTIVRRGRKAYRVIKGGGADESRDLVLVESPFNTIRSMNGWLLAPDREPRAVTRKEALTSSLAPGTLYMDTRLVILHIVGAEPGSVVGFEWEEESLPLSIEDEFSFQGTAPVRAARYSVETPAGTEPVFHWVNYPAGRETREEKQGSIVHRLEMLDIPALEEEPFMPDGRSLAGRLVVGFDPGGGAGRKGFLGSWNEIGNWYRQLSAEARTPDFSVQAKAGELTNGQPDLLATVRALAGFVQREVRYVGIQIGIGGYQPHPSQTILSNRFGDCKDKATLLAALLGAKGIDSYYVIINTTKGIVTPQSPPSLNSFDHVILAVALPGAAADVGFQALLTHPRLGRLLLFDPTAEKTPFGSLPAYLQGNTGLLVTGDGGELLTVPSPPPEANRLERKARLTLGDDGALNGRIVEMRNGAPADLFRYRLLTADDQTRRKYIETYISAYLPAPRIEGIDFRDMPGGGDSLAVEYGISSPSFSKRSGGYVVLRPHVLGFGIPDLGPKSDKPRAFPIDLGSPMAFSDEFSIELPPGLGPLEAAGPVEISASFAVYRSRIDMEGRSLVCRRELRIIEPVLPASHLEQVRSFFLSVAAEEARGLLLTRPDPRR